MQIDTYRDFVLRVQGHFDAAHYLTHHDGKCASMHGHTWKVEAELAFVGVPITELKTTHRGILVDFADLKEIWEGLDHTCLNDSMSLINPTCEVVASYILEDIIAMVRAQMGTHSFTFQVAVTLCESEHACVTVTSHQIPPSIDEQFEANLAKAVQQLDEEAGGIDQLGDLLYAMRGNAPQPIKVD